MSRVALLTLLLVACAPKAEAPVVAVPAVVTEPAPPQTPEELVQRIAKLEFRNLVPPVLRWDWVPPLATPADKPHNALVVLVEFSDVKFDRFASDEAQGTKLAGFYQDLLFDSTFEKVDSLSHYYANQSSGRYHLDGTVLPPVQLDSELAHYGAPVRPEGGDWRNDGRTHDLVEDALVAAREQHPDTDWSGFDHWDLTDFDNDGNYDEADGYVDHLILVYAGKGQHACQRYNKLNEKLNPNTGPEVLAELSPDALECANRLWPHRSDVTRRESEGPPIDGTKNIRGGAELLPNLWVKNYNMQCEYTSAATFIHETGHSLGLPDVYSRTSSNSTGLWEVMSHTSDPSPQAMSAWSRMQLGWMEPDVVLPPNHGGEASTTVHLGRLSAPGDAAGAVLVALPPKIRQLDLVDLDESHGEQILYSGQGNELNRSATLSADLDDKDGIELSFDAWWEIEGGWDFAYVELDAGDGWKRLLPTDRAHMPAKHGHDGAKTLPGFTGFSGDLDGDGKNESHPDCDPKLEVASGEDKVDAEENACLEASWVRVAFDLSAHRGAHVDIRLRYFTDGAAVENGLLIDNLTLGDVSEDFEDGLDAAWTLDGFSASAGAHTLLVPHFYLLEYRDPYAETTADSFDYDKALAQGSVLFYYDSEQKGMAAMRSRPRPGVVAWYFDGAFPWSENDPALNGPGSGYLLAVDSSPNEVSIPAVADMYKGSKDAYDTHFDVSSEEAQAALHDGFYKTMCFVRKAGYYSTDLDPAEAEKWCKDAEPAVERIEIDGAKALYREEFKNILPGAATAGLVPVEELFDYRKRKGEITWRMYDRGLRNLHTFDNPFSPEPFEDGRVFYKVEDDALAEVARTAHPAVTSFSDADAPRWLNPKLHFGGVVVPTEGLSWEVSAPAEDAPAGTEATIKLSWSSGE